MKDLKIPNNLINEKSPYLLQHAYNPVNWFPWNDKTFEKAKNENKPIFLSIGYSTCHWCHVMEHESFEDEEVAKLLNENFISIKVDREERPDIDQVYMTVCQIMTGSGGWPLTIIMKPDKKPFFAGTYFPKNSRHGRIGMIDLLPQISEIWKTRFNDVIDSSEEILGVLNSIETQTEKEDVSETFLEAGFEQLKQNFDSSNGGFGRSPKFPTPHKFLFLLRYYERTKDKFALEMVEKTLQYMREGGVYDHVGFGFHRYSTDEHWLLPHFEKMLYDQALLALAYTETYQLTKNEEYAKTAKEILTYVSRDMTDERGGFYSAEDADSEGEEGKFYVWTESEIKEHLKENADLFIKAFNIRPEGNYIEEATRQKTGSNILHTTKTLAGLVNSKNIDKNEAEKIVEKCRKDLFEVREKKIHPYKDDKILTDWNGLMITAFARASQVFNDKDYLEIAKNAVSFIFTNLYKEEKLLHRYRDGESGIKGNLDDYAFLTWGLIELYESSFDVEFLQKAISISEKMIELFYDTRNGGFHFTPENDKDLIVRMKEIYDGAVPSGNSIAIMNYLKLFKITGDKRYEDIVNDSLKTFAKNIKQSPISHSMFMTVLEYLFGQSYEIVVSASKDDKELAIALNKIRSKYIPNKIVLLNSNNDLAKIAPFTVNHIKKDGKVTFYICQNQTCKSPITDLNDLESIFK